MKKSEIIERYGEAEYARVLERCRVYDRSHREGKKAYREAHRVETKESKKEYYKAHQEEIKSHY